MRAVQTICYDLFSLCGFFAFRLSYTKPFLLNGVFDWRYLPKPISFRQCISQKHTIHIIVMYKYMHSSYPRCHWRNTMIDAIRQFLIRIAWRTGHAGSFRIDLRASDNIRITEACDTLGTTRKAVVGSDEVVWALGTMPHVNPLVCAIINFRYSVFRIEVQLGYCGKTRRGIPVIIICRAVLVKPVDVLVLIVSCSR